MTMIFIGFIASPCSTSSFNSWAVSLRAACLRCGACHVRTDHPNVLMLHETFEDKSHLYLVRGPKTFRLGKYTTTSTSDRNP